jgi:peroxiredoxin
MTLAKKFDYHLIKKIIFTFFTLYGFALSGQETEIKKLEYVIVTNDKIITKAELEEYGKQGLVKSMKKGVTEEERNKFAEKFGDKIGDREFIIKIGLLTQEEKLERQKRQALNPIKTIEKKDRTKELFLNVNDVASDFTVKMVDGTEITLSDLKGKVVFVNYWATWCAPCLVEFAEIPSKILEKFNKKNLVFIPIAIGENKEKVQKKILKMEKYGVDFNVGVDPGKTIWNQYATGAIPKSFLIDKKGIIKYISIGNTEGNIDRLAMEIEKLLSE